MKGEINMSCCDPKWEQEEHDELYVGQCSECGADVDEHGQSVDMEDCNYSPVICEKCGYRPCDQYC